MFIDIDCTQQKKYNQNAYGDYFLSKRYPEEGRLIAVLSDGLGSGIKANILASMTATMLLKFIEAESNIKKSCEIIMNSLPVCKIRRISYSTFSAIDCNEDGDVKIVEEGNPDFLWIRDGEILNPEYSILTSKTFANRKMHIYKINLKQNDRLIFCSDGVTQAGLGNPKFRLGLRRSGLINIVLEKLEKEPSISSRHLSKYIVKQAELMEVDKKAKDDISCCAIYYREPRKSLIFTGPPYHQNKDKEYCRIFSDFKGKKAICGGTTANLISRELNLEIKTDFSKNKGNLPATSFMDGIDLTTEGILTLTKTVEYLEENIATIPDDAAGELMKFLFDSDCIDFMIGAKLNQAHYDPSLPVEIEIRKNIVRKMADLLEKKYMKKVKLQYM